MQDLPWRSIWFADNPVEVLNARLLLLVVRFVPTKVICFRNKKNLGLMISIHFQTVFERQFSVRNRDVLMNAQSPRK